MIWLTVFGFMEWIADKFYVHVIVHAELLFGVANI